MAFLLTKLMFEMRNHIDVSSWTCQEVQDWLIGICDDSSWLFTDSLVKNNIAGTKLLVMTPQDLESIGATKVNLQEYILEAIESLKSCAFTIASETLQVSILRLACQSRSLQKQLATIKNEDDSFHPPGRKDVALSSEQRDISPTKKQKVSLETLSNVSSIVTTIKHITKVLNSRPFSIRDEYRSMKSLILALSIELASTAQRDQFVERPNDILERSSKTLADYCDRIVLGTDDPIMIQPFRLEAIRIRKTVNENDLGLTICSPDPGNVHIIDQITPLSPANKTDKLNIGDEILQFNQYIVGWSAKNVERLLSTSTGMSDVILMVKKCPDE